MGVVIATTDLNFFLTATDFPKRVELYATVLAHEVTHLLIDKKTAGFNRFEHTVDPNGNGILHDSDLEDRACLMLDPCYRESREYSTVKFFPVVQAELSTRTSEGLA